jgi:mono/diheme cytochrome c family protein
MQRAALLAVLVALGMVAAECLAVAQGLGGKPAPRSAAPAPPPQASPDDIDGPTMFATSCGWCHSSGGKAAGRGPKLAGTTKSDEFIIDRIKKGKSPGMPAFGRAFSDGQIIAILAYIRSLDDDGG